MNLSSSDLEYLAPLTPQALHVLVALAQAPHNGHELIRSIVVDSGGSLRPASGTIYPLLKRLLQFGYIRTEEPRPGSGPRGVTNTYYLTDIGRTILELELDRYQAAVSLGRYRLKHRVQ